MGNQSVFLVNILPNFTTFFHYHVNFLYILGEGGEGSSLLLFLMVVVVMAMWNGYSVAIVACALLQWSLTFVSVL